IATNKHVVQDRNLNYTVSLADGRSFEVKEIALDPSFDFAVVKIEAENLPFVELGSSDALKIGERVIAIGNAVGEFQNSVTAGVVSALNRTIEASDGISKVELLEGLIQTDAAINPGNSGGPMVNLAGQVVGVNTATDLGSENIGFAIPIDDAKVAVESVIKDGKIVRPLLGVRYVNLNKEVAELNHLKQARGAYVTSDKGEAVVTGSPAAALGIKQGDIVLAIGEDEIQPERSLAAILRKYRPGDKVTVKWLDQDKERSDEVSLDSIGD
ncbi:MAG: trypsin-like peptidase domain-containing protein, partial [Parcubacteria group bacterium]